ncbi:3'(2'),5'-bisphosphate nucleotidase CysQ [Methylovirgula ligni]|uniref:3'(2'),5'-bisphosphate nucleotidase CysQ n=1 Tax=Methylovirgula ligni TaxID=569860 RepID=UPI000E228BCC|nr:3'(2'),5'-bisphosphate nucleotidase CysQ [Methylovirgula ligni]QAY97304.1 3'(2'),5'-bisphosphate nucleotidase CysQ [Methylovirgula ligni]
MNAPLPNRPVEGEPRSAAGLAPERRNSDVEPLSHDHALVAALTDVTRAAGALAQEYFRPGEKTSAPIHRKEDGSPVTEADLAVNRFLEQRLRGLLPAAGWLSEESADAPERRDGELVLVVDPIDGTRAFATGNPVWAVSVALVDRHRPVIGIVHAPALAETYVGVKDAGARLNGRAIEVSRRRSFDAEAMVGGPFGFAQRLRSAGLEFELLPKIPSLAVRVSKVAAGALDAALISANAHDWDIAACDLIVTEAGGTLRSLRGRQPLYNRVHTMHGELVAGPEVLLAQLAAADGHATAPEL